MAHMESRNRRKTPETLGARLKQLRIERNLTLAQMGDIVGLTPAAVWKIEQGDVTPNDRSAYRIKQAFPEISKAS